MTWKVSFTYVCGLCNYEGKDPLLGWTMSKTHYYCPTCSKMIMQVLQTALDDPFHLCRRIKNESSN